MRSISPEAIVLAALNAPWINRLPDDEASNKPKWLTDPHDPVAAANSIAPELDVVPPEAALKLADTRE